MSLSTLAACQQPLPPDVGVEAEGLSVCPGATTLTGVDVSTYQGTVDWGKVKASGRAFAITRVGDGLGGDNTFDANWAGIKAAGMVRGAYQYFRASDDPNEQADILLGEDRHAGRRRSAADARSRDARRAVGGDGGGQRQDVARRT